MRRRAWFGWSTVLVVGVVVFVVSIAVAARQPWEHYTGLLGAVVAGQGLGQLIRGWWRTRHGEESSRTAGDEEQSRDQQP